MKQGRPPPPFIAAVVVVCACVAMPLRQTPKGVAPPVVPGSDLDREIVSQLVQAREALLSRKNACWRRDVGWCGADSPWVGLLVSDGFRWSMDFFDETGLRVGSEAGGCRGRWRSSGIVPDCRVAPEFVSRELCEEAFLGLERQGATLVSRCLGNNVSHSLPIGRSVVEVLADDGALSVAVDVPRSTREDITLRVEALADDLRLFELENQNPFPPRRVGDRIGRELFVTSDGGLTDLRTMIGQGRLCSFDTYSLLQPVDAGFGDPAPRGQSGAPTHQP